MTWTLRPGRQMFGGDAVLAADVHLTDRRMDSRHIGVTMVGAGGVTVVDLGSANGTRLNGRSIDRPVKLMPRDLLQVGDTFLQLVPDVAEWARPEPDDIVAREMIGPSPAMRSVRDAVRRLSTSDDHAVLIRGPSGSGKGLVARLLYEASGSSGPLRMRRCRTLTKLKVLATDVQATVLLRGVEELEPALQAALARALQERRVRLPGSDEDVPLPQRVLLSMRHDDATGQPTRILRGLRGQIAETTIDVPPLRERRVDIIPLVRQMVGRDTPIQPEAVEQLLMHDWPSNVRGLAAVIDLMRPQPGGAVRLTEKAIGVLKAPRELPGNVVDEADPGEQTDPLVSRAQMLERLLRDHGGRIAVVARVVDQPVEAVREWVESYGLTTLCNDY